MCDMQEVGFMDYFEFLEDPRHLSYITYPSDELLFLTLCSVLCGAEGWEDIELYVKSKLLFLQEYMAYENGIPSDDTLRRYFRALNPEKFADCFQRWVSDLKLSLTEKVIAIDGKTSRCSHDGEDKALHMVSAFASEARIVLGQEKVDEKSNEITAIPKLLELLDISGSIVTIDAMGCQQEIVTQIIKQEANYIIAVKDNQKQLHQDIKDEFTFGKTIDTHLDIDLDHGRIETRKCSVINDFQFIEDTNKWEDLKSIIKIESIREFKNSDKTMETATRYYISNLEAKAEDFQNDIRLHWAIENKLHWVLDVAFSEDASRKRAKNAAQNFSVLSKISLNILKKDTKTKQGIKGKRLKAAYDNKYLSKILDIKGNLLN